MAVTQCWPGASHAQGSGATPQPQGVAATTGQGGQADIEWYAFHAQSTVTEQASPGFPSRLQGRQSLSSAASGRETVDATAYLGVRPWAGAELWLDPEIDQGFGLGDTFGVAGFLSGEAYKAGATDPYFLIQRLFLRQTIDLGGNTEKLDPDLNQLGQTRTADRLTITAGKFGVTDVFDTNIYAHDPRNDFLNWSLIDDAGFDYAANAWGFTYGAATELYLDRFALRLGAFNLSDAPNGKNISPRILGQFQIVVELEERHTLWRQPGKLKFLYWLDRGELGSYDDAIARGLATDSVPATGDVRSYKSKDGVELNIEQRVMPDLGFFARAGVSQGSIEEDAFTDVNTSVQAGVSIQGSTWKRPDDAAGLAFVVNEISHTGKDYLAAGGLGVVVGDGALPNAGPEQVFETYYNYQVFKGVSLTADYQLVNHPAYDTERGPLNVLGIRLHAEF